MKEIITESKREYYYTRLYIDEELFKRQRQFNTVVWAMVGAMLAIVLVLISGLGILGVFLGLFVIVVFGYMGYKMKYKELMDLAKRQDEKVGVIFPEFLQVFMGMIEVSPSGGILKALKLSIPYIKNPVKSRVIRLVFAISADGSTSNVRQALQIFGQYVGTIEAVRILDIIYTMYVDGVDARTLDLASEKIEDLNRNTVNAFVEKKKRSLMMKSLPALILGVAFIFVFVGIVAIQYFTGAMSI